MGATGSGKHSSLLGYSSNYCCKKFYSTGPNSPIKIFGIKIIIQFSKLYHLSALEKNDIQLCNGLAYTQKYIYSTLFEELALTINPMKKRKSKYNNNFGQLHNFI
jgi:hypothetical protein